MVPYRAPPSPGDPLVFDATLLRENDGPGMVGQTFIPADAYTLGRSIGCVAAQSQ